MVYSSREHVVVYLGMGSNSLSTAHTFNASAINQFEWRVVVVCVADALRDTSRTSAHTHRWCSSRVAVDFASPVSARGECFDDHVYTHVETHTIAEQSGISI